MDTPPGWYPDPREPRGSTRYWDGRGWTENVRPAPGYGEGAPPASGQPGPVGQTDLSIPELNPKAGKGGNSKRRRSIAAVVAAAVAAIIAGLIVLGISSGTKRATPQRPVGRVHLQMGQRAVLAAAAQDDGIVSATVYSLRLPFTSQTDNQPVKGDVFGLGDVQVCAGGHGANTFSGSALLAFPLSLVMSDGDTLGMIYQDDAKEPSLPNVAGTVAANRCVRGWVTFEVPSGDKPVAVGWGPPDTPEYEWAYSPS